MIKKIMRFFGVNVRDRCSWNPYALGTFCTGYYPEEMNMRAFDPPEAAIGRTFLDKDDNVWEVESWEPRVGGSDLDPDDGLMIAVKRRKERA